MDPLHALAEIIVGWHRTKVLEKWLRLVFGMAFSWGVTFCTATGTSLTIGKPPAFSIGTGLLAASGAVCLLFTRSDLTKGVTVAGPNSLVYSPDDYQVAEKK